MIETAAVTVITPVYNGEKFLVECIESVLAQTYANWEYFIVDNCSTDRTVEIARMYARRDKRITVVTNTTFVGVIESHNRAFRYVPAQSKYCKVLSADDWIYPQCIERLVEFAERNPSAGIVQACQVSSQGIRCPILPHNISLVPGKEAGRMLLLGTIEFTGPTTLLYRSSLIRSRDPFFPGESFDADAAGTLKCLEESDMGFVNEVLAFQRVHDGAETKKLIDFDNYWINFIDLVRRYGPSFLKQQEIETRIKSLLDKYFHALAVRAVSFKGAEYWKFQNRLLREHGYRLLGFRMLKALGSKIFELALSPKETTQKLARRFFSKNDSIPQAIGQRSTEEMPIHRY